MRPSWDEYFLGMAEHAASMSTCDRARVGCVLVRDRHVLATGFNGSAKGMPHCDDAGHMLIDGHCQRVIHAEQNAVAQATLHGVSTQGATVYLTHSPCPACARLLAAAGIVRVFYRTAYRQADNEPIYLVLGVEFRQV